MDVIWWLPFCPLHHPRPAAGGQGTQKQRELCGMGLLREPQAPRERDKASPVGRSQRSQCHSLTLLSPFDLLLESHASQTQPELLMFSTKVSLSGPRVRKRKVGLGREDTDGA